MTITLLRNSFGITIVCMTYDAVVNNTDARNASSSLIYQPNGSDIQSFADVALNSSSADSHCYDYDEGDENVVDEVSSLNLNKLF